MGIVRADVSVKKLAPGVTLTQEIDKTTPLVINVVNVDLTAPGIHVGVGIGQDQISGTDSSLGREDVSRYARRHQALVAVNADFFPFTGDPLGVGIQSGKLFSEPSSGSGKTSPRAVLGVAPGGRRVFFGTLGFLGDLKAADGQSMTLNGINRAVNPGEIVAYSPLYGPQSAASLGGTIVVLRAVNLPVRANKRMTGQVESVQASAAAATPIPPDGVVLSGGPDAGADFLAAHCHAGDTIGFVLGIAPPAETAAAVRIAELPRTTSDLPSRAGLKMNRQAFLWAQVPDAVGGGPHLLVNNQIAIDGVQEGFNAGFTDHTNPRTAVGTTADGKHLLIVTVDGRQAISAGVTLPALAAILKRYGATDAINLDGGSSTEMAVGGLVVNSPSGAGYERPVADMLVVTSDKPRYAFPPIAEGAFIVDPGALSGPQLVVPSRSVMVGDAIPISLQDGRRTLSGASPEILWRGPASGGVGFVNQKGYFTATKPGAGTISALYHGKIISGLVTVQGSVPPVSLFALHADFVAAPSGASNRSELTIRVLDQNGKPQAATPVHITITGGVPDVADVQTSVDGSVTTGVTWNADSGGSAQITSGTLKSVTLPQPKQ